MSRIARQVSPFAAPLRQAMTDAERKLWYALRDRRFVGLKFRRQHSIGPYVADFACVSHRLVIELDGGQHGNAVVYDDRRTAFLEGEGWAVMRFWNNELFRNLDGVMTGIAATLAVRGEVHPHPGPR